MCAVENFCKPHHPVKGSCTAMLKSMPFPGKVCVFTGIWFDGIKRTLTLYQVHLDVSESHLHTRDCHTPT